MGKFKAAVTLLVLFGLISGCGEKPRTTMETNKKLHEEKTGLKLELETLRSENQQLKQQVKALSKLDDDKRVEFLSQVAEIELTKRTGFFDKDKDGVEEKLIVYLRPFDDKGDTVKAAGWVYVQLWDLQADPQNALLEQWEVTPDKLKDSWAQTFMTNYYRLIFDLPQNIKQRGDKGLTLKVRFTEYLTGKVFEKQTLL